LRLVVSQSAAQMTISVSEQILKAWCFQSLPSSQTLAAEFHSIHVYEVQGFTLEAPSLDPVSGTLEGLGYALSVGASVNAICLKMVGDKYVESEEAWQAEHKCTPPYLVVHLGPTTKHESIITHAKNEGRTITTYSRFPAAKAELREIEGKVLPPLLSALACRFSSNESAAHFLPTDHAVFGITLDNRTVLDFSLHSSAQLTLSSKLEAPEVEQRLASGVTLARAMNPKVARFFQLALDDDDPLKKFLYFFLAIEIETHATFRKIDHAKNFSLLITAPDRVAVSTHEFFDAHRQRWTNLRDRFVWCVLSVWTHLCDADVEEFVRLKSIRDEIAHGSLATPPHSAVVGAQKLASKLQLPLA
jgi:hypothetical protein